MIWVSAPSPDQIWALGTGSHCPDGASCPLIEHSSDAGRTWQVLPAPALAAISFVDRVNGWLFNDHDLWRTRDGGVSWQPLPEPPADAGGHLVFTFADPQNGWATSGDTLWSTHDGGADWRQTSVPGTARPVVVDGGLARVASRTDDGEVFVTTGPTTTDQWTVADLGRHDPAGGRMYPELHSSGDASWLIVRGPTAIDAMRLVGGVWQKWDTPPCGTTGDPDAISPKTFLLLCGFPESSGGAGERLFASSDGGDSFVDRGTVWPHEVGARLCGEDPDHAVVALDRLERSQPYRAELLTTSDAGHTWTTTYTGPSGSLIGECQFLSPTTGYAYENDTTQTSLLITYDGGQSWNRAIFAE